MSVIPAKERLSQKGCHKTVTGQRGPWLQKTRGRKQRAQYCHFLFRFLRKAGPHTSQSSAMFGHPHSPANNSSAALECQLSLNFPFTSLCKRAFLNTAPASTPLERKLLLAHFLVWRLVSPPPSRTCSLFLPEPLLPCHTLIPTGSLTHES